MRQIIDDVFELRLGFVNVHLTVIDDGVVLIDTGLPGRRAALRIESALHDVHRTVGAVTHILLTHKDPDHTGGVAELRRRSGARVVAHEADAPVITAAEALVKSRPMPRSHRSASRCHISGPLERRALRWQLGERRFDDQPQSAGF